MPSPVLAAALVAAIAAAGAARAQDGTPPARDAAVTVKLRAASDDAANTPRLLPITPRSAAAHEKEPWALHAPGKIKPSLRLRSLEAHTIDRELGVEPYGQIGKTDLTIDSSVGASLQTTIDPADRWTPKLDVGKPYFAPDAAHRAGGAKSPVPLRPWVVSAGFGVRF